MRLHDEKSRFYSELYHKIDTKKITADEFIIFANKYRTDDSDDNHSGFFELCAKFVDISLNAKKFPDPTTCDVPAVFLYADVNAAKAAFKEYVTNHKLSDIDGVLEAIRIMHMYAILDDDTRTKSATITPKKPTSNTQVGYVGKFHNFRMIPNEMWIEICQQIKTEI
ncbi:MAG: hypothetical protein IK134_11495 [Oscillospiraceae bacterium]|nr:hypothetical protein [Oscillospiraceae bacterium]